MLLPGALFPQPRFARGRGRTGPLNMRLPGRVNQLGFRLHNTIRGKEHEPNIIIVNPKTRAGQDRSGRFYLARL